LYFENPFWLDFLLKKCSSFLWVEVVHLWDIALLQDEDCVEVVSHGLERFGRIFNCDLKAVGIISGGFIDLFN
jgi:hypothetical protein